MKGWGRTIPHFPFFTVFLPRGSADNQMKVPTVTDHGGIGSVLESFIVVGMKKIKQCIIRQ
jgi:hypothetical protein